MQVYMPLGSTARKMQHKGDTRTATAQMFYIVIVSCAVIFTMAMAISSARNCEMKKLKHEMR